jgi:hypothetical protein
MWSAKKIIVVRVAEKTNTHCSRFAKKRKNV